MFLTFYGFQRLPAFLGSEPPAVGAVLLMATRPSRQEPYNGQWAVVVFLGVGIPTRATGG